MIVTPHLAPPVAAIVGRSGGARPLVLGPTPDRVESLADYLADGGYPSLPDEPADIRGLAEAAGLRGAGGAGFPTALKLNAVADAPGPRVVVANGEEGEPSSVKDRWLQLYRPHLVLDGLRVAAAAVQAERAVVYVSNSDCRRSLETALSERTDDGPDMEIVQVDAEYVAGEETAVVRAIEGDVAKPLPKPPRPFEKGVHGQPTLVSNVESLARLALAVRRDVGALAGSTVLATVLVAGEPLLVEVPGDFTVRELLQQHSRFDEYTVTGLLVGGFAGGIWGSDLLDAVVGHQSFRERGAIWGCGSIMVLGPEDCPIDAALDVALYLRDSSSGQCGACVRGTQIVGEQLEKMRLGTATEEDVERLVSRTASMPGRGNCGLPAADALLVDTLLRNFAAQLTHHEAGPCAACASRSPERQLGHTRFRVFPPLPDPS